MLIEGIGKQLTHKPFEWMSWWWGVKWGAFIDIHPPLSKENPLWQREDSNLENVQLFGLPPNELQEEIAMYWEKPFWRRWLLSFFTAIDSKIVIWSYYKRCLSFRMIHKENPALEQRLMVYDPEKQLLNQLINKLKQDNRILENRLERYSGNTQWIKKNLSLLLAKHEKKRQQFFSRLLNKHLKALPVEYNQKSIRKKLEEEYQELEKMLRKYVENSYNQVNKQESVLSIEENPNRALVYVGPAEVSEETVTARSVMDLSCSVYEVNNWVSSIRKAIEDMLKEDPPSYEAIQSLLRESFLNLQVLIQPQLNNYQDLVNEARINGVHPDEGIKWLKFLETRLSTLTSFFRNSVLLFHPDKSYGDENIRLIKTELFKEFRQFTESSLEKFNKGLKMLKRCIPQWEIDFNKMLEEIEHDRREFREWFDQKCAGIEVRQAETEAKLAETEAKRVEMETENAEIKARQAAMEETINKLLQVASNNSHTLEERTLYDQTAEARGFFRP